MCIAIQEHCFLGENVCINLQYKMKSRDNVMGFMTEVFVYINLITLNASLLFEAGSNKRLAPLHI